MRRMDVDGSSLGSADVWRQDRNVALGNWLAFVLMGWLASRRLPGLESELNFVLVSGLEFVILAGIVVAMVLERMVELKGAAENWWGSATCDIAGALVHLAIRHKVPLRLIAFLEDARNRHLLRTVGPVYQFRHAKLQDRLAQETPERSSRIVEAR